MRSNESALYSVLPNSPQIDPRTNPLGIPVNYFEFVTKVEGPTVQPHVTVRAKTQDIAVDVRPTICAERLNMGAFRVLRSAAINPQRELTNLTGVVIPALNTANHRRVSNDPLHCGRGTRRPTFDQILNLSLYRRQFLTIIIKTTQGKPADLESGVTRFHPLSLYPIEAVVAIPTYRREVLLALISANDTNRISIDSTTPQPFVSSVLPILICDLPLRVGILPPGTGIGYLVPLINIVLVSVTEDDGVGGAFASGVKSPRDPGLILLMEPGSLYFLPRSEASAGQDATDVSEDSSIRSHPNILASS